MRLMKDQTDGTQPVVVSHACLAGTVSGFVNSVVSCPIELVKTRLQMQIGMLGGPDCVVLLANPLPP